MPLQLDRGEFFGRVISTARWDAFRVSETRYARGALLPWHRHEESYLTFVLSGGYRERSAARAITCGAPSIVLHPAGDTHEDDFAERPTRCLNVVLDRSFVARLGTAADALHRGDVVERPEVASIGAKLAIELRRGDAVAPLMVEGLLLELFATLARQSEDRRVPSWLAEAQAILARRFMEKVTLGALASEVGVHPTHFARAFRRYTGASVGECVRALRIEWSRMQLASAEPLASIAAQAGFSDQSHFTKAFTRVHGIGPAEYRRRLR
ncbi:MAG TPA: AraC family transcriptional regulator [Thermoanaerobaculia bacterium]|nr:AraC family transcriptional regulator [Thermoanaerobaculia bacterium]